MKLKWNDILEKLPNAKEENKRFFQNEEEILCEDQDTCNVVADFLEEIGFNSIVTGYYEEDDQENEDGLNGYWYIGIV